MAEASAPARPKRSFWLHQVAEYLLGLVLVSQGLQSPTPVMPAVAGGVVVLNVALAKGPLSAFGVVPRPVHRWLDLVAMAVVAALAVQPWVEVEGSTRVIMVVIAGVMAFIWWQSDFTPKVRGRAPIGTEGGRSTEVGRMAGRAAGSSVAAVKRWKRSRES